MALLSGIAAGTSALGIDLGDAFKPLTDLFNRDDCTPRKRQTAQELKEGLRNYTTRQDRVDFLRGLNIDLSRIAPTPEAMSNFYIGEGDCKHKNVSARHQRFLDQVVPWLQEKINAEQKRAQTAFTAAAVEEGPVSKAGIPGVLWIIISLVGIGIIFNVAK